MTANGRRIAWIAAGLGLVGLIAAVYGQVAGHGFVNFDDPGYIRRNGGVRNGLTSESVAWAFRTFHMANWHPLTWLSHMVDVEMWGMDAGGHHLNSVALHALNAVLLLVLLTRTTGALWTSALVAALFAVHPLRVESVAWASERKDVLAGTFFMLALLAHVRFARRPDISRAVLVWLCMALGLMAKPMLVTLPFVLLLLDVWPLGRWDRMPAEEAAPDDPPRPPPLPWTQLLIEKVPLLLLSIGSVLITINAQSSRGAVSSLTDLPLAERLANVPVAYLAYLRKAFLPTDLAFYYPHLGSAATDGPGVAFGAALGAATLLIVVTIAAVVLARRGGGRKVWFLVGWFWFLGLLVPVIGLVQVGSQALADRYAYLPLIGITIPLAWGLRDFAARGAGARAVAVGLGVALVAACLPITWRQAGTWRNSVTLYEHALKVTTDNHIAHANLGVALMSQNRLDDAAGHLERAIAIAPNFDKAHTNLGNVYMLQDRLPEAATHLKRSLAITPRAFDAAHLLGRTHAMQENHDKAVRWLLRAVELNPNNADAYNDLGLVYGRMGRFDEALGAFQQALTLRPAFPEARANAAKIVKQLGD
jgi:Flp pilus assembly protein TadD